VGEQALEQPQILTAAEQPELDVPQLAILAPLPAQLELALPPELVLPLELQEPVLPLELQEAVLLLSETDQTEVKALEALDPQVVVLPQLPLFLAHLLLLVPQAVVPAQNLDRILLPQAPPNLEHILLQAVDLTPPPNRIPLPNRIPPQAVDLTPRLNMDTLLLTAHLLSNKEVPAPTL